jgi:hypothetical protein
MSSADSGDKSDPYSGDHDPYTGNSYYRSFQWPENVHILAGDSSFAVFEDVQACVYAQAGIQKLQPEQKPGFPELVKPDYFNILLVHGTLDMGFSKDAWNPWRAMCWRAWAWIMLPWGISTAIYRGPGGKATSITPEALKQWVLTRWESMESSSGRCRKAIRETKRATSGFCR